MGCPALCRDEIKEGMVASNPGFIATTSDPLTLRTNDLFFDTVALFLRAEVTHVVEAAFQHSLWWRGLRTLTDLAHLKVIRCVVSDETARSRHEARLTGQASRVAHADAEHLASRSVFEPIHLAAPTLDVDTSHGWRPTLDQVAAFCSGKP